VGCLGSHIALRWPERAQPVPTDEQIVITAEHVVTASGKPRVQRDAQMLNQMPLPIPVEHTFIV